MNKILGVVGAGVCVVAVLAGCSSNKGGDTTCGDFNKMDAKGQTEVITAMLKDEKGKEPNNLEIAATKASAKAFCKTLGKDSSKVKDIKTG
ncbi:hypothetical protein MINS_07740 [Mycolicibacterium insubricum]|uniref:Uncharacterized protein n=1 Tax=Mycolicibacterium insubricum TaxID=444597 RepID=A0A1X0CZW0_9MYCO|nr:hypothetical protein [Mycolicibacterium insubricum]MCB9439623.1 hypothetical protein [Mycolicibacterium sp.]MCV7084017.1 hypothetical protein [Mycolicibacterium insubricum]ORA65697.1 hypothetical protein BST26_18340 [Mycolicibacterium insubricum]BBZ65345.1 hypothetical protein MINS_07740 [Mycolicibacterium insubricum]